MNLKTYLNNLTFGAADQGDNNRSRLANGTTYKVIVIELVLTIITQPVGQSVAAGKEWNIKFIKAADEAT